jgi:hypothetical protein
LRRFIVGGIAALGLVGVAPAATPAAAPASIARKTCSGSFTHGVIGGVEKCLRRGEFCARAYDRQYRRYGFRCVSPDARGPYHLT